MDIRPQERVAAFIDGANLFASARALGFDIDFKKLLALMSKSCHFIRAFYYTALFEDLEYSSLRPLIDWLDYNGYTVVTKRSREYSDSSGHRRAKGSMDIELAIDMLDMADKLDHILLFSGDGDFRRLVEAVQRKGVRVTVVSTVHTNPAMVASELRRQADMFVDLQDLAADIARSHADRPQRPQSAPADDNNDGRHADAVAADPEDGL